MSQRPGKRNGRPPIYVAEFAQIAETMIRSGATEFEVARALDVDDDTIRLWKGQHPDFLGAIKTGKELQLARVERSLYHRACGYSHESTKFFHNGNEVLRVPVVEHYPPDTGALCFYLKNADPARYKDRHDIVASIHDKRDELDMSDEELIEGIRREQALRLEAARKDGTELKPPGTELAILDGELVPKEGQKKP